MDSKIVKKTQDTLGKIIKKPPLTEKLLGKPPFRFLHDVFTEVIRTTGFLKGLFSAEEMDSKNVTAKEAKIVFLQKVVDCVTFVSGETLAVRPSKVIAGHEPENTNELLQIIARCIRKKISSEEAVQMVHSGKSAKSSSKSKSTEKPPSGSKKSDHNLDQKETSESKTKERSSESTREKSSDRRRRSSSRHKDKLSSSDKEKESEEPISKQQEKEKRRKDRKHRDESDSIPPSKPRDEISNHSEEDKSSSRETGEGAESSTAPRAPRPASAKGQRRRPQGSHSKQDPRDDTPESESPAVAKKLARPPSARPAAPRVKQRKDTSGDDRIDSGGQQRSAPIIVDNNMDSSPSDDDDQFVVEEEAAPLHEDNPPSALNGLTNEDVDEKHGSLVKSILDTKKELEHSAAGHHVIQKHTEIQRSNATTAQQRKEQEMIVKEIEQLRNSVQKLCQSAAPLAKIVDYIQEDVDAMQNELRLWKAENSKHAVKLKEEEAITQKNIEPLNVELQDLEQNIVSYRNQMAATKANIIRNDEKIRKMVLAVATRS